uniref:Uncharacterized protein n=1 Tax=Siphoviridae sp. ct0qt9 TaxID=2825298 RepID=A0A8S5NZF0_9CAUD|nr:MAG TPA: hypothetical protein [Siphoviridae sp. ct0qt9]
MIDFQINKFSRNVFVCLFFNQYLIRYWLIMRFFISFLLFLRSVSQNLIAKIDRTFA